MKLRYLLRETRINLWRNVSLTIATVFAVAVSLALFGSALMVSDGIGEATKQWEGDIEFQVWMNPDATPEQNTAITEALETSPQIRTFEFINQQQAFVEFQELFADTPELLEAVVAEDLPPSYRVVPENPDANSVAELGAQFRERPGVKDVVFASERQSAFHEFEGRRKSAVEKNVASARSLARWMTTENRLSAFAFRSMMRLIPSSLLLRAVTSADHVNDVTDLIPRIPEGA